MLTQHPPQTQCTNTQKENGWRRAVLLTHHRIACPNTPTHTTRKNTRMAAGGVVNAVGGHRRRRLTRHPSSSSTSRSIASAPVCAAPVFVKPARETRVIFHLDKSEPARHGSRRRRSRAKARTLALGCWSCCRPGEACGQTDRHRTRSSGARRTISSSRRGIYTAPSKQK